MTDSIFTKIINRELPAEVVYEDEFVIAFLDIAPIHKGHTLVVPKKQFVNIFDGDSESLVQMMRVAQKLGLAIKESLVADGINLSMNNGEAAGQEVPHAHLHIIPRFDGDNSFQKPLHKKYKEGEMEKVATKIKSVLKI